jgi:hypothetical protein
VNWNPYTCWWEWKLVQPLWKPAWRFLKKLKIELPFDPLILFLGIYAKEHKTGYNRGTGTHIFITAKLWKKLRYPKTDKCIRKCGIYTEEFYSTRRNNDM